MKKNLIIFGTQEIADLAHFYFTNDSDYEVKGFTIDDEYIVESQFNGLPVIPYSLVSNEFPGNNNFMHIAISYQKLNKLREEKFKRALKDGYKLASYISSKSVFWKDLKHGRNCLILENQTIQPKVSIGDNVMIWSGNHIGHGSTIGDHSYISSHVVLSGHTRIGKRCFLGVNSTIKDFCEIGDDCFVGMSSSVTKNMPNESISIAESSSIYDKDDRKSRALKRSYFKL